MNVAPRVPESAHDRRSPTSQLPASIGGGGGGRHALTMCRTHSAAAAYKDHSMSPTPCRSTSGSRAARRQPPSGANPANRPNAGRSRQSPSIAVVRTGLRDFRVALRAAVLVKSGAGHCCEPYFLSRTGAADLLTDEGYRGADLWPARMFRKTRLNGLWEQDARSCGRRNPAPAVSRGRNRGRALDELQTDRRWWRTGRRRQPHPSMTETVLDMSPEAVPPVLLSATGTRR